MLSIAILLAEGTTLAAEEARPEPADSAVSGEFLAPAATRLSWFDRMPWGSGGGKSSAETCADLDRQCARLEPFYGCTVDTIVVSGNTHTKTVTILREMATKQGARLEERLIRRDASFLRGLAYFAEVGIEAESVEDGKCRIMVTVVDRPGLFMRVPYPVVNYDFEKGLSYGVNWKIKNFRGLAEDLSVTAMARRDKEDGAGFSWNIPWVMGRRVALRFNAYAYKRIEVPVDTDEDYIKEQYAVETGLGVPITRSLVRQLWFRTTLSFEGRDSRLTFNDELGDISRGLSHQNFVAVGAELSYDSRADRISPFSGMLHRARLKRYSSVSGPEQHYIFYGFSDYFYVPVGVERSFIIALDGDIREGNLPSYYLMKLGGVGDVRGFSDNDLRGTVKLVGSLQYRARLFGPHVFRLPKIGEFDVAMNGVAFFDNGSLMDSILDANTSTVYSTGGLGIEIISPFRDLIRLEMASDGTGKPAFYMTAGASF
ncbi:MAG: BamA/TamA family outer membrane protein [Candidatus Krumholzibacteria bacterium]|nr:BamA/TamA family outer membrane protein [Candidatus Krumholzibacteria bacterium]